MPAANTAHLWDSLWNDPAYRKDDVWGLEKERLGPRWRRLSRLVQDKVGEFESTRGVELGAGAGKVALLCALEGADVTLVDYSEGALERARALFDRFGARATFIHGDLFDLPSELLGAYDVSMSFGLTEHFQGDARRAANVAHLDVLRDSGLTFIAVPNALNPPYRAYKWVSETLGTWKYGEEYPYRRRELAQIMAAEGVHE